MKETMFNIVLFLITWGNLMMITLNRNFWVQVILVGLLVAETGLAIIYEGNELLGLSTLIIYNGALLVLFTIAFLLIAPSQIRSGKEIGGWGMITVLMLIGAYIFMPVKRNPFRIAYQEWTVLMADDPINAIKNALLETYLDEFTGVVLLLLVGILATIKILKTKK